MLGRTRKSSCTYKPASNQLTPARGLPLRVGVAVMEYWLGPKPQAMSICRFCSGVTFIGGAASPICSVEYAWMPVSSVPAFAHPVPVGVRREPNVNFPLKLDAAKLESRLARKRPPNFRKCLPSDMEV